MTVNRPDGQTESETSRGVAVLVGRIVDQVNHRAAGRNFEHACLIGGSQADLPTVAGASRAAHAQFIDAEEQAPGHDRGLLKTDCTRDGGGM